MKATTHTESDLTVVHVLDSVSRGNFGIVEAAIGTSRELADQHGIASEVWFPEHSSKQAEWPDFNAARPVPIQVVKKGVIPHLTKDLDLHRTVVLTHGAWQFPTRWGATLRKRGCPWIYAPHGMLEPWSLRQKKTKKWLYLHAIERRLVASATIVRATASTERGNLEKLFPGNQVALMPHGIDLPPRRRERAVESRKIVLFMGRFHTKKGVIPLVKAWLGSALAARSDFELFLVGFDDGEMEALKAVLATHRPANIRLLSPVYGEERSELFARSTYFVLPSHSEGLPVAPLLAMGAGLVPLLTDGCNLPEAFAADAAIRIEIEEGPITEALNQLPKLTELDLQSFRERSERFARDSFGLAEVASEQARVYRSLI